ncbi:hypothetical protein L9F63_023555 [Diploptera punctata]|uniref:Protein transport protein Sec24B n=1 Tax=Diploptera punctata TaxID=6984 RepID=A0AAD7ZIR8_DIPPU|nr:hypothetical protein L9F63_023555 [Diploptera punctata]
MAHQTGPQNIMLSAAQGVPSSAAPTLIPNGQPSQWNRPPTMPHAMKSRPPPTGSNITPSVSNGTPTPSTCSHPGSSSSQSSRGPSPIPPNHHSENFFNSTPNLTTPFHSESPSPSGMHRGSPRINVNASQHRIPTYTTPRMAPTLVNQNIDQSKSTSGLASSQFPPADRSGSSSTSSVSLAASLKEPSNSYSQGTSSSPPNIPSQYPNMSDSQQRLGASQLPPQNLAHISSSNNNQHNVNGPETSKQNAQTGINPRISLTQSSRGISAGTGYPQQGMPAISTGYSQGNLQQVDFLNQIPTTTNGGFSQTGKSPSRTPPTRMPPTSIYSQPGMPPSGYSQPGMPPRMPPSGYSQPGMPPTSGYSQPAMPPTSGYSQPGMAPSSGISQQAIPPTSSRSYPEPTMPNQYQVPPQTGASQQDGSHHLGKRYPQQQYQQNRGPLSGDAVSSQMAGLSVTQMGFNKIWGMESVDLLQNRNVLPADKIEAPKIRLHQEFLDSVNCSTEIFRCTLTKIPETNTLLQKSRLPLGILIHPFKDLNHLPVIQCSTIVRCRSCRTYINPFVYFVDHKRWKCNLCFRVNELPEEFQYDPVSKTYGDPTRRPEVKSSTIEFIAPSEYMLRPPQPAVYLFLLDVSRLAVDCGYLRLLCDILLEELDKLPGDGRTQIGFITYDSCVHFYNLAEGLSQPQQMIVVDTDDVFLPCPDNLLVNLSESRELVKDLLNQIPTKFLNSHDTNSTLGAALQAAYKLMAPTGGRVTVFQTCLPNHGPGMLTVREDPSQRAGKEAPHLNPATDFYKRLALDCSGQQIAVDLFLINCQYSDLATLSGISRFSGGCIYHFPLFKASNTIMADSLERSFRRYLTRKIGFEAVMRIRCSRSYLLRCMIPGLSQGMAIHTFHGNFFVRSTDLLSLPNVNPDAGFGMQVSIEESLSDLQNICFQAALLYTSSKAERRIRVHTLCLPVAANLSDILHSADQQCIVGLLAKMAVDRSHQSSLSDARDAFINVAIDVLSAYKLVQSSPNSGSLLAPGNLQLLPLYILALLKYIAFRTGQSTRLDDRLFAMCQMKSLPLTNLIQAIYPDLYPVHYLSDKSIGEIQVDGVVVPQPPHLHLSAEKLDSHGAFLMDTGDHMMMYVGHNISNEFCSAVLGVPAFSHIPEEMFELPENESTESEKLRNFVNHLQSEKPYQTMFQVIRDDSHYRAKFIERLIEDRSESALSYYEFLQHLKSNVK